MHRNSIFLKLLNQKYTGKKQEKGCVKSFPLSFITTKALELLMYHEVGRSSEEKVDLNS